MASSVVTTASVLSLCLGTVLPLLVGLVSKASWNSGAKATILALCSAATAFLTQWLVAVTDSAHFEWQAAAFTAFGTFLVGAGTHYQVWKPLGVSASLANRGNADPVPAPVAPGTGVVDPVLDPSVVRSSGGGGSGVEYPPAQPPASGP